MVVRCGSERRCAKVFKEANKRSFKQAVMYQEGRKVRKHPARPGDVAKDQLWSERAGKDLGQCRSGCGSTRCRRPGSGFRVRRAFVDGVLLMELITDAEGRVAPRLDGMVLDADTARNYHDRIW